MLKNLPAMPETQVRSLGWEDPLEKEMATHSSTLAWRIPWREEPGRLLVHGVAKSRTQLGDFTFTFTFHFQYLKSFQFSSVQSLSRVQLFVIPWTVVDQASLSMGFSRQEYWSVLPFPSPGDLPDPGIKPRSAALQADAMPFPHVYQYWLS